MAFRKLFRRLAFYTFLVGGSVGAGTGVTCLLDNNYDREKREEFVSEVSYLISSSPTTQDFSIEKNYSTDLEQTTPTPLQDYPTKQGDNQAVLFNPYMSSEREDNTLFPEKKTRTERDQIEDFLKSPQEKLLESLECLK